MKATDLDTEMKNRLRHAQQRAHELNGDLSLLERILHDAKHDNELCDDPDFNEMFKAYTDRLEGVIALANPVIITIASRLNRV